MPLFRFLLPAILGLILAPPFALADASKDKDKPTGPVSYYREVRRILQQNCQGCHQPAKAQGGYVMTSFAALLKPGDSGKAPIVPGQPDQSELVAQIVPGVNGRALMPKNRDALSAADIAVVKRWIAEGGKDDTPSSVQDTIDEKNPPVYLKPPIITAIDISPDGKVLAVAGYHEVLLHHADGSGLLGRLIGLSERIQSLAFSPDGSSLAAVGGSPGRFGEVQIWDVAKKRLRLSVPITYDTLYGVSWSPDGKKLAFGCADNSLRAIDAETGKQILFQGAHADWVLGTTFSQDGEYLVSVSRDMSMKLTVVATQRFVDNITSITPGQLKGGLQAVALRPQIKPTKVTNVEGQERLYDEVIIGGSDGAPHLYKIHRVKQRTIGDNDNKVRDYPAMPGRIFDVSISKDGNLFAAGSSLDGLGELRVYDVNSGKVISTLDKIPPVYTVRFHPDGKQVASAGFDGIIRFSEPATGKVIRQFLAVPLNK